MYLLLAIILALGCVQVPAVPIGAEDAEDIGTAETVGEFGSYFQGDILITEEELDTLGKQGLKRENRRWPNKTIPYTISSRFRSSERRTIEEGIALIASKTCIEFKPRTTEKDYVNVGNSRSGCFSELGRAGNAQTLNLGRGCVYRGIVAHEFIHALGFLHEQSRNDRDDFVTINTENIQSGAESQFKKVNNVDYDYFGVTYDYGSIMHYPKTAFSKNGKDTITVKQAGAEIGQRRDLSDSDAEKINNMYNC